MGDGCSENECGRLSELGVKVGVEVKDVKGYHMSVKGASSRVLKRGVVTERVRLRSAPSHEAGILGKGRRDGSGSLKRSAVT